MYFIKQYIIEHTHVFFFTAIYVTLHQELFTLMTSHNLKDSLTLLSRVNVHGVKRHDHVIRMDRTGIL
jgi:hypothetical protein